jgi:hypothetical protein
MQIRHVIIKVDDQDKALSSTRPSGFCEEATLPYWSRSMADRILAGRGCGR